jgi:hypothetical protein
MRELIWATGLRIRAFLKRQPLDRDLEEELRFHLDARRDKYEAAGMVPEDADAAARRRFGNVTGFKEASRDMWTFARLETLGQDFRYALRCLRRNPVFAAVAIITLGLGIGAATAIFSVVDNVLLAPFPYKDAGRMVFPSIHDSTQPPQVGRQGYFPNEFLEFARHNHVFDAVIGTSDDPVMLSKRREGVEFLYGADVTPGAFEFFGMRALYGRVLQPADYQPGAPPVFVMRYKTWQEHFNSDPGVLNKPFLVNKTQLPL